jgi:Tol biopolymer transport system component
MPRGLPALRVPLIAAVVALAVASAAGAGGVTNGRIAFVSRGWIYTIRPDGTDLQRLDAGRAKGDSIYRVVAWSPDGRELAAVDDQDLYLVSFDGSRRRVLAAGRGWLTGGVSHLVWSPRGDEIALGRLGPSEIDLLRVSDGSSRLLVRGGAGPSWTPGGAAIVYWRQGRFLPGNVVYDSVWQIRRDGTHNHRIAERAAMPAVSPNGALIAFTDEAFNADIGVMSSGGRKRRIIARGNRRADVSYFNPSWSPDGRFVLATRTRGFHSSAKCCDNGIAVIRPRGGGMKIVHRQLEDPRPTWQPVRR